MKGKYGTVVLAALLGGIALGAIVDQAMKIYLKLGDMEDPVRIVSDPDEAAPEAAPDEAADAPEAVQEEAPEEVKEEAPAEGHDETPAVD